MFGVEFDPANLLTGVAGGAGIATVFLVYIRAALNAQKATLELVQEENKKLSIRHQACESYLDVVRGALINAGISIPARPIISESDGRAAT